MLNKEGLKISIKNIFSELKSYDGSGGKTQEDAIEKLSSSLADAIDTYVKTALVSTNVTVDPNTGIGTGTGGVQ